jgi:hypothetical protein
VSTKAKFPTFIVDALLGELVPLLIHDLFLLDVYCISEGNHFLLLFSVEETCSSYYSISIADSYAITSLRLVTATPSISNRA